MEVLRPDWWCYPERCSAGHEWGPGRVIVAWRPCQCPAAVAAHGEFAGTGHQVVYCNAEPGCPSVWYRPPHEPADENP